MNFINNQIIKYVKSHSCSESELLSELRRETELKFLNPIMLSGEYQGRLLSMISKIKSPDNILEIGTYTGYSTLCLAEGLNENGQIHTIDKNEELSILSVISSPEIYLPIIGFFAILGIAYLIKKFYFKG